MLCNNAMLNSKCQILLLNMTKYAKKMRNVDDDYKVTTRTAEQARG